ncbi:energy transducer TonB [Acidicapsa acidisoli]|uniref:energy transducer TonB n=1 Tax=Acidicapsa acidisoli TaxID=1615681 RepID=UPI0021DFE84C|nr:energy transducer TonB [Acidicapsa acidisoli]
MSLLLLMAASVPLLSQNPSQNPSQDAPAPSQPAVQAPATNPPASPATPVAATPFSSPSESAHPGDVTEDELKQLLVGKQLFLRGGYLGDSLSFTEHGSPTGHPTAGSYTLSGVEIEKVHLTKHKVELVGARYALHFLGALPYEDASNAVDRVKITPKKKVLRITIDREQVVKPKKAKEAKENKADQGKNPSKTAPTSGETPKEIVASSETDVAAPTQSSPSQSQSSPAPSESAQPQAKPAPAASQPADQTPEEAADQRGDQAGDQAADQSSVTTTISPAHAAKVLRDALDRIFAEGLDTKVMAQMPQFWQLYYQAQAAGADYRPKDPAVLRSSAADQQAKVLSSIAPDSNEFAQANGIAGRALYRAVIGTDGKPGEIAVVRPIGFGLDENAVAAIRKATFQPAVKNGQPVAETLDLAVLFRIYSKRTSVAASEVKAAEPVKPGPYTVKAQQQPQQNQPQQDQQQPQ